MSKSKRTFIAALAIILAIVVIGGIAFVRSASTAPGLDTPVKVQDGSVQVKRVDRVDSFDGPDGQKVTPSQANQFVLVDVNVTGTVSLASGSDSQDLANGKWQLTDANGAKYPPSRLSSGKLVFEVDKGAKGLVLELGNDVKIPLERTQLNLLGNTSRLRMAGNSMAPTFSDGQTILAEPVNNVSTLQRGDVIIFTQDGAMMIKRLIALPGETIEIRQGSILINGKVYDEPYKVIPANYEQEPLKLGADEYYVLGDNRNESSDSHNFGPVTGKTISKRVVPQN